MRVHRAVLVMAAAALGFSVPAALAAPAAPVTHEVSMASLTFTPGTLSVQAGDTVVWTNDDAAQVHTVTADDGSFDSGAVTPGTSFSHTFTTAGTVPYYCQLHGSPGGDGMAGSVTVQPAATTTTTTVTTSQPGATPTTAAAVAPTGATAGPIVAEPDRELPRTGSSEGSQVAVALALLATGTVALAGARRRRARYRAR